MGNLMENPLDITAILKPGVYLLKQGRRVVFVARARCLLMSLAAQRSALSGPSLPEWFPIKRIPFDGIEVIPTDYPRAALLVEALIELHQPLYNNIRTQIKKTDKEGPPPIDQTQLVRRL